MTIEHFNDQHLLVVRWESPGIAEDFIYDDREILTTAQAYKCFRWLLDLRQHGDTTQYNADDLFRTVLPNTKGRFPEATIPKIALLVGRGFTTITSRLPDDEFQERRHYKAQIFTDEGSARTWLTQ
jgi:hypothetical protein